MILALIVAASTVAVVAIAAVIIVALLALVYPCPAEADGADRTAVAVESARRTPTASVKSASV